MLFTVEECASLLRTSVGSIRRDMALDAAYVEYHMEHRANGKGASRRAYIDPASLGRRLPANWATAHSDSAKLPEATSQRQLRTTPKFAQVPSVRSSARKSSAAASQKTRGTCAETLRKCPSVSMSPAANLETLDAPDPERHQHYVTLAPERTEGGANITLDLGTAAERVAQLQPLLRLTGGRRRDAVLALAKEEGVSERTVYRWLDALEDQGVRALVKSARADKGKLRIPQLTYDLIVSTLISNSVHTSIATIHRTLSLAVPDVMTHERGGRVVTISEGTVRNIKRDLQNDAHARLLFMTEDERKEYLRTYSGSVVSQCANDMWQLDASWSDVEVFDPETERFFRPRVHAVIDVFSGCIPGLHFTSGAEDQSVTNEVFRRALTPKIGPLAAKYPIYGIPARLYWDNGKTYRSAHAEQMIRKLGIVDLHSRPKVSHTRGKIERWFSTLHEFECTLTGYVGEDAVDRDQEALRKLKVATLEWHRTGRDPGVGRRHLTLSEYRNAVLHWLIADYHQRSINGKRRLDWFVEHVRPGSQVLLAPEDLYLITTKWEERVVTPDGGVKSANRLYKIPDGSLVAYKGMKVRVYGDDETTGDRRYIVAEERNGALRHLGEATLAPMDAASLEAGEMRRRQRGVLRSIDAAAKEAKGRLANPELTFARQLELESGVIIEPLPAPAPTARLTAVNPVLASEDPSLDGWADDLVDTDDVSTMTPQQILEAITRRHS